MSVFEDYGKYYDLLYCDKDYSLEAKQVHELLYKYKNSEIHSLLDLGCGSGRHDIELQKLGYDITGVDQSETMIEMAQLRGGADYQVGDIRKLTLKKEYDAAVSLFHVISYINSNSELLETFHSTRKLLYKGAIFLFSTWYGPGVLMDLPETRFKEVEDSDIEVKRVAVPVLHRDTNIVDVNYSIIMIDKKTGLANRFGEMHCMRYYFEPEMRLMLDLCGFRLIDVIDEKTLSKVNDNTWTCFFVAEAI